MLEQLPQFIRDNYVCKEWRHASSILMTDFGDLFGDVTDVLSRFKLKKSDIVVGGGSKTKIADWIDTELTKKGWVEEEFTTRVRVERDKKSFREYESPTHKVDCFKANKNGGVGFEIEWNNKDPFFDRDLNNFRLLFELRTVSVGIILTRSEELNAVLKELVRKKLKPKSAFGESTTHWGKLEPRLEGGAGGGCPILALGIKPSLYVEDVTDDRARELIAQAKAVRKAKRQAEAAKLKARGVPPADAERIVEEEAEDEEAE